MQTCTVLVHEVASTCGANIPGREVRLTFMKSGYVLGGYILTERNANFGKDVIRKPGDYAGRLW